MLALKHRDTEKNSKLFLSVLLYWTYYRCGQVEELTQKEPKLKTSI